MSALTHLDEHGNPRMVDVSSKAETHREAVARGAVYLQDETLRLILEQKISKGDVLQIAQLAGIMAAKKTADLIPLCHPLPLSAVHVTICAVGRAADGRARLEIEACVKTRGQTGVEMEALTAVSAAALCVYDMSKAVDREMEISEIALWKKSGGKSGDWTRSVTQEL